MEYKRIAPMMGHLWSPIAAVTSRWEGKLNAQIVVTIAAASIVPSQPRVLVQIYKRNLSHDMIYRSGSFALNFLRQDQPQLILDFGLVSGRDKDKLADVAFELGTSGSPVLQDSWGYLDCRVVNALDGGDMTCFLGEILEGDTNSDGAPFWWRDAARQLPKQVMEEWDRKVKGEIEFSKSRMKQIDHSPWKPGNLP